MQNRITEKQKLLNEKGEIANPGYATSMLYEYNREDIKASPLRLKEWDYYYIGNQHYAVCLTIADNGYMSLVSASLLNFDTKFQETKSKMGFMPKGKLGLPRTSEVGNVQYSGQGVTFNFVNDGKTRTLYCKYPDFHNGHTLEVNVKLTKFPADSMVIATPFREKPGHFYFNQKINCMEASGSANLGGREYSFDNNDSLGLLDWGRGVWTYKNTWYWGSMNAVLPSGDKFGWNIGYGFGDTSAATENMLFFNGKAHKLDEVTFNIPQKENTDDFLSDWTFTSNDKRFEMKFRPIFDRFADTNALIIRSCQHQVFGLFSGTAILDDGKKIEIKNALGFAEKVSNKW